MVEKEKITKIESSSQIPEGFFSGNQQIERIHFVALEFIAKKFVNSLIRGCTFEECQFVDCIFDDMDLQRVNFLRCGIRDSVFSKNFRYITGKIQFSEISSCDLPGAFIQNVKMIDSKLEGVDFRDMKAKSLDFSRSKFENVNFDGAHIIRGTFKQIPGLHRSLFYRVKIDDCTFDWNEAFVVMQFGDNQVENLYQYAIVPVLEKLGVEPKRTDRYEFEGRITDEILQNLVTCRAVIAECSAANKNVYFEVGYALGNKKTVVFLVDEAENIPFDLKDYKFLIHHNNIDSLKEQLERRLRFVLGLKDSI